MAGIVPQQTISNILQANKPDDIYTPLEIELYLELVSSYNTALSDLELASLNRIRT